VKRLIVRTERGFSGHPLDREHTLCDRLRLFAESLGSQIVTIEVSETER
jgi:hypothetical protein